MSAILATQPGPLTWVKPEIDFALERVRTSLKTYFGDPDESAAALTTASVSVREVTGALQIIGMEALGTFSREIDAVLVALASGQIAPTPAVAEVLDRASSGLDQYLSELMERATENIGSLRPLFTDLAELRGSKPIDELALFHPDLNVYPPPLLTGVLLEGDDLSEVVRQQRMHFQRGMLAWLRGSSDGLVQMRDALQGIENVQPSPGRRVPWWVSSALVEGLLEGGIPASPETKRVASRIDRCLASFATGVPASADLIRELLLHLVRCKPVTPLVREVRSLFDLDRYRPLFSAHDMRSAEIDILLRRATEILESAESNGSTARIENDLRACLVTLRTSGDWSEDRPCTLLIEAMLAVLEGAVANTDLPSQLIRELSAAVEGLKQSRHAEESGAPEAGSRIEALREKLLAFLPAHTLRVVSRSVEGDRALLQAVSSEMSATLQQVEESLEAFFREQLPSPPLSELPDLMRSVTGALSMLGVEAAAHLVDRCINIVASLEQTGRVISREETTLLAEGLSSVALYVRSLDRSNENELRAVETILARFEAHETLLGSAPVIDLQMPLEDETNGESNELDFELTSVDKTSMSPEAEAMTTGEIRGIFEHFDLSSLRDESPVNGTDNESNAVVPPTVQGDSRREECSSLGSHGERCVVEVDAKSEGTDPEIVSIFVEEANELLKDTGELLDLSRADPSGSDGLHSLRRTFHTLKGSGRMAGLHAIGDAASTVEILLNEWLESERPASAELVGILAQVCNLFTGWIDNLAQHGRTSVQGGVLAALTAKIRREIKSGIQLSSETEGEAVSVAEIDATEKASPTELAQDHGTTSISTLPAPLFDIFVDESRQTIAAIEVELSAVARAPDQDAQERLIRAAHTLAGIARTTGFQDITLVASVIENAPLRQGSCPEATLPVLHSALAALHSLIGGLAEGRSPHLASELQREFAHRLASFMESGSGAATSDVDLTSSAGLADPQPMNEEAQQSPTDPQQPPALVSQHGNRRLLKDDIDPQLLPIFLDEVHDLGPLIGEDLRHLRNEPTDTATFDSLRRVLHTIKGGARMVGAIRLGELVHVMEGRVESALDSGSISQEDLALLETEFDRLTSGFELLEAGKTDDTTSDQADGRRTPDSSPGEVVPSFSAHIRVAADSVDRLLNQAGEISISRGRIEAETRTFKQFLLELTESVSRLRGQLREIEIHAESRLQATQQSASEHNAVFDPLELDRFTRFQELTRLMTESLHDVTTVQQHLLDSLDEVQAALNAESRLNQTLQDDLMRLRTVTFQTMTERLYRVARQAARESGKKVEFDLSGGHTEVDRGILERVAAPLEHLVRNAVVHGIESPEERADAGKAEVGSIQLTLWQETNELLIALADDGRGIDYGRVQEKAVELGWLTADAEPSPSDLERIILRPGFSTAAEINELAGRGVGMDVVANEVHALGGNLAIETAEGKGTKFTIRVPLTLAVAKTLLVSAAGRRWAILSNVVEQVQELPASRQTGSQQVLEWLGHRYPLVYLPRLVGEAVAVETDPAARFALLVRSGDRRVAVLVDQLAVNQDLVLKALGPQLAGLPGVNGVSVLPDGDIVFVVNPALLMERCRPGSECASEPTTLARQAAPLIMIVDDSLTVRNVTSRLLVRHGYRVITARDGLDALQQIQQSTPDALLVDIEMPRMDGFELTKNLKASERTAKLPIIMITSRLASKHREYADQLGVNVYLGKPYEEQELLTHLSAFAAVPTVH